MPYPEQMVAPMRAELTSSGIQELRSPDEVDTFFRDGSGLSLLLVNSVCGCAAGSARPAILQAMEHGKRPQRFATVFAGQDLEATARARELMGDVPPSSPSVAVFRDQELVHFMPRHLIEGRSPEEIAGDLTAAFDTLCS
ncbi:BrxA/BrxB family bacilliredoxin [bacterium CG17_big_fil_post_rev_8_21_14_2_50_64_8]|nr:MAG: BrxA/BrxB family bacilliredoxin [bacterium CG17_big_fil_post_rev_8_21_14_2_50_64_8]PJA73389.1 MAG: BrxA/BrxB family bacilliredoxin [bacterium CG_4_9_14_3_um_filter_65_15]